MDAYSLACLIATIVAIVLRRFVSVRVVAVAFLLWIGIYHHVDLQQAERMLMDVDAPSPQEGAEPELDPDAILHVLQRTPAGFVALLCLGALALLPARRESSGDQGAAAAARR